MYIFKKKNRMRTVLLLISTISLTLSGCNININHNNTADQAITGKTDAADSSDAADRTDIADSSDTTDSSGATDSPDTADNSDADDSSDTVNNSGAFDSSDENNRADFGTGEEKAAEAVSGNRIYYAAPLFNEAEREYNLKIVNILESYGYEVFLPQRDGFLAPDLEGKTEEEKIKIIFQKDKEEVLKSDIVFMLLDGRIPDEGACIELGIAYANGKRCYGFKSDARSIEADMDLNPMIAGCFNKIFFNLDGEDLIRSLEDYLEHNRL